MTSEPLLGTGSGPRETAVVSATCKVVVKTCEGRTGAEVNHVGTASICKASTRNSGMRQRTNSKDGLVPTYRTLLPSIETDDSMEATP